MTTGEETVHERIDIFLQQRLSARDLDERTPVLLHLGDDIVYLSLRALVERVRRVAPRAAKVAGGETHEHARLAGAA